MFWGMYMSSVKREQQRVPLNYYSNHPWKQYLPSWRRETNNVGPDIQSKVPTSSLVEDGSCSHHDGFPPVSSPIPVFSFLAMTRRSWGEEEGGGRGLELRNKHQMRAFCSKKEERARQEIPARGRTKLPVGKYSYRCKEDHYLLRCCWVQNEAVKIFTPQQQRT